MADKKPLLAVALKIARAEVAKDKDALPALHDDFNRLLDAYDLEKYVEQRADEIVRRCISGRDGRVIHHLGRK